MVINQSIKSPARSSQLKRAYINTPITITKAFFFFLFFFGGGAGMVHHRMEDKDKTMWMIRMRQ